MCIRFGVIVTGRTSYTRKKRFMPLNPQTKIILDEVAGTLRGILKVN